jgi:antitoxin component YwqK of YwqJK toxin-antitoxin module
VLDRRRGGGRVVSMKKLLFTTFVALLLVGCGEEDVEVEFDTPEGKVKIGLSAGSVDERQIVDAEKLTERDGLIYLLDEEKPFTGVGGKRFPHDERENIYSTKTPYVEGKKQGIEVQYHSSGKKTKETSYVEGKRHGLEIWYGVPFYSDKQMEIPYENGKKHGTEIHYHKYGAKKTEIVYENGKQISSHDFGPERPDAWKDDPRSAKRTMIFHTRHSNGEKESETIYKRLKKVSYKEWDEAGNLIKEETY